MLTFAVASAGMTGFAPRRADGEPRQQHTIRAAALRLLWKKVEKDLRAIFLFAFDQEAKVDRRPRRRGDRLEQAEDLSFVVGGATRVDPAVADGRLEGRLGPFGERIGRLYVVMSVNEQRWGAGHIGTFAPHDGMCLTAEKIDVATAQTPQLSRDPFGSGAAILVVYRQGRDGGNPQKVGQLAQQTLLIHGGRNVDRPVAASQREGPG